MPEFLADYEVTTSIDVAGRQRPFVYHYEVSITAPNRAEAVRAAEDEVGPLTRDLSVGTAPATVRINSLVGDGE